MEIEVYQGGTDEPVLIGVEIIEGPPPTMDDVVKERQRRLALGFNYDFGDERGIHRIGTTDQDMAGWREVTDVASALLNLGQGSAPIQIATDTGTVQITPIEWQQILVAAAIFRQPIWQASFALMYDPNGIPLDYADDSHWPPAS